MSAGVTTGRAASAWPSGSTQTTTGSSSPQFDPQTLQAIEYYLKLPEDLAERGSLPPADDHHPFGSRMDQHGQVDEHFMVDEFIRLGGGRLILFIIVAIVVGIGFLITAKTTGALIVPVVHNAGKVWPAKGWPMGAGEIRVVIGPTLSPVERSPQELSHQVHDWMQAELLKL